MLGSEDVGLLVLVNEEHTRQLTIPCDREMKYQFSIRMNQMPFSLPHLPEVMSRWIGMQHEVKLEILISGIVSGEYRTYLYDVSKKEYIQMRASDAVLFSYVGGFPIYIDEALMQRQSIAYKENAGGISLPINSLSENMLQTALDKAIKEERYEMAAFLADELKKRKGKSGK